MNYCRKLERIFRPSLDLEQDSQILPLPSQLLCHCVSTGILKLVSVFASGKPSATLATYFTQHILITALNGLLTLTSIGWHVEVHQLVLAVYQSYFPITELWFHQSHVRRKHQMITMNFQVQASYTQLELA